MTLLRVGGVPEPFNEIFMQAREGALPSTKLQVEFLGVAGGSGAALEMLAKCELDVAVTLTESAVARTKAAASGLAVHSVYVASPLAWGVAVSSKKTDWTDLNSLDAAVLRGESIRAGFSRRGSGSHLLLSVFASDRGWISTGIQNDILKSFECGSFDGLIQAAVAGDIDMFLWETCFTKECAATRQGLIRLVGEYAPSWPAFVLVCRDDAHVRAAVSELKREIEPLQRKFCTGEGLDILRNKYGFSLESAKLWLSRLQFAEPDEALSAEQWRSVERALELTAGSRSSSR
jgi:hypothetical protein